MFLNLKNSFFYYNTNPENVFLSKSINLYEIDSLKARILINLPDSLNCGSWGVDFYHPSKINLDSISDSACYSVFLHVIPENDDYIDQPFYNTFFNLEGEILRMDMKKMDYVPLEARQVKINAALSNSFGFGGHNGCLVVGKV